ncbi:MAG: SHD1 domain-containing protein [Planctomycetota bacterium]
MSKPFAFWVRFATIVSLSTMASIHATANASSSNGIVRERYPFPTPHRATSDWSTRLGGIVAVGGMLLGGVVGTHDQILVLHGQSPTTTWLVDFVDYEFEGTAREPLNSVPSMVENTHVVICDTSPYSSKTSISGVPKGGDDWDLFTNPGTKPPASPIFEDPMAQYRAPSVDAMFGSPVDSERSEFLVGRIDRQIDGEPMDGGSPAEGGRNTPVRDEASPIEAPVPRLEPDRIPSAMLFAGAQDSADKDISEIHRDAFRGAEYRVWNDNTGTFSVTARVAIIFEDCVRLRKENGRTTTVPMRRLSEADRLYVQWVAVSLTRRATQSSQR